MGYYKNIKCGHCSYSFTGGFTPVNGFMNSKIGIPYIQCPKCQKVNVTGDIPWSKFSNMNKIYHWTSLLIRGMLYGFFLGMIIWGVLINLLELDLGLHIFSYIGIGIVITISIMIRYNSMTIKKIEEICNEEDWGYLLSNTKDK